MHNINDITERMRQELQLSSNKELANALGVSYNTFNTWKKRGRIPAAVIDAFVQTRQLSYDWLLVGKNEVKQSVNGDNNITAGSINGNVSINTSKFSHKEDIMEIIELLEYAPSGFLSILKEKLLAFKKLSEF